jgi:hypothetical protein
VNILKNIRRWTEGMTQVAEQLPSKCKALSQNLSTGKKKKLGEKTSNIKDLNVLSVNCVECFEKLL